MASKIIALVVAGGQGERLGGDVPKQYQLLGGVPVLQYSLDCLCVHPRISAVRTVIHPDHAALYNEKIATHEKLLPPVSGGDKRQDSVRLGLESLRDESPEFVLIHDAARPFLSATIINRVIAALEQENDITAVIPAIAVKDTLKKVYNGVVGTTIERTDLFQAQTPQGFAYSVIMDLHRNSADDSSATDDASLAEQAGIPVHMITGEETNTKITTDKDMQLAQRFINTGYETRCGSGYDIHRLLAHDEAKPQAKRVIRLCGVAIPHDKFLQGHSDADVALHALVDAILGTIGEGDIGVHFPPSDPKWRRADSRLFVLHAQHLLQQLGGEIVNADITIQAEQPKLKPHYKAMRETVAEMLNISADRVSVKSTTTEKLGSIGRGEAIAAHALVTIRLPGNTQR